MQAVLLRVSSQCSNNAHTIGCGHTCIVHNVVAWLVTAAMAAATSNNMSFAGRLVPELYPIKIMSICALMQVETLLAVARIKPVVNQVELHPFLAQRKMVGVLFRKVRWLWGCISHFAVQGDGKGKSCIALNEGMLPLQELVELYIDLLGCCT